ncbi:putative phage associated membrane protein [Neisseria mucosa]|nr:putative phage associated membrane protein [Neisseria mucosa]
MNPKLVKLLANNWQPIAIIALVGTGLAVSHHQGYKSAFAKQQVVIDKMEREKIRPCVYRRKTTHASWNKPEEAKQSEAKAHPSAWLWRKNRRKSVV